MNISASFLLTPMPSQESTTDNQVLDHAAEQRLRNDIRRDAARARKADTYDVAEHVQQLASKAEDQTGADRHHDSF